LITLKGVTNYLVEFKPAVSVILTGQKEITHIINTTHELKSRLSIVYSLKGFELDDTYKYMMYRLSSAGAKVPIFSREAIMAVHDHTGGRPREINKIAMLALQYGALNKSKRITAELILRIYADQYGML
jgi:type II secretory pathway predicted ATPase ExeA